MFSTEMRAFIWNVDWLREQQTERLNQHLKAKKAIWQFRAIDAERDLDSLLCYAQIIIDDYEKELKAQETKQPFWKKFWKK